MIPPDELKSFVDELWEDMFKDKEFKDSLELPQEFKEQLNFFKIKITDPEEKKTFKDMLDNVQGVVEKSTKLLMETMIKGEDSDSKNIMELLSPVEIEFVCNEISEKIIKYRMNRVKEYLFETNP